PPFSHLFIMQSNCNTTNANTDYAVLMTSDDLTSSSNKKRSFESDDKSVDADQISSAINSPSPAKIHATSTVNSGNT
ncbi:MAG: hypothetical protein ACK53L_26775, partial [Pirellulaceae bacterium]